MLIARLRVCAARCGLAAKLDDKNVIASAAVPLQRGSGTIHPVLKTDAT